MQRATRRSVPAAVLLALTILGAPSPGARAQAGPGLPALAYPQSQMFTIIATLGSGSHGHALMVDGWLAVLRSGGGMQLFDVSNPYAPVAAGAAANMGLSEPHTCALTTAYGGRHLVVMRGSGLGGRGFGIWDLADPRNPSQVVAFDIPGVPGGYATGLFWIFAQGRYLYCPAGSLGLYVVDTAVPASPLVVNHVPKSALGGFNTVLAFAVGNTLVLANSDGGTGYALLDISDPVQPVLVHSQMDTPIPYGAQVNADRFLVPAVSGCVSCPGGNNGSFVVHDIGPASFPVAGSTGLPSRGGSAVVQDGFVHIAASRSYLKLDLSQPGWPVVGQTANPNSGGDFDWVTPLGNLAAVSDDQGFATKLVPHAAAPDTTGPQVTMVVPRDNAVRQAPTSRIGITMSDMVDIDSLDASTFSVQPIGGQPVAGDYCHQFGIVNFSPREPLLPNTTYEVLVPAGGVRDWAGNATPVPFRSVFSTGPVVSPIHVAVQSSGPVHPGQPVTFAVTSVTGTGPYSYSWDFGDGSPPTPFAATGQATHAYAAAGHYAAQVTVTDGTVTGSGALVQTVHHAVTPVRPTRSSTVALDGTGQRLWCVNADNDTVTAVDTASLQRLREVPAGSRPRTLALAPDGTVWVVCEGDATVRVLHGSTGAELASIALPRASAPYGIAFAPHGAAAYVTLRATGRLARLDPATRALTGTVPVGPDPRGIAVAADSERILVTRFRSAPGGPTAPPAAEIHEVSAAAFAPVRTIALALDPGPDTENSGRGVPNYLHGATIAPDGRRAWVPSKKDNVERGLFRDLQPLTFESTVRTIASQIDLLTGQEDLAARIDFNDRDMAFAIEFSPLGDYAFVALQGSNAVEVRDAYTGDLVAGTDNTGLAPQGLLLSADGQRLFVHNFLSRTVAVYDAGGVTSSTSFAFRLLASVPTVALERLPPDVLRGKQIFYNAADPRMSADGYISCASCHLDGGHDGRTWDFTDRGEGLRNTTSLLGRSGLGHGRVHWTANFDEIQDFENDIRGPFGGTGFLSAQQWQSGTVRDPLGQPKAGLSPDLDALAAYVSSLSSVGRSPHREPDGSLTVAARRGEALFAALGCAACHSGPHFTDSALGRLHDVGTRTAASGMASGGPLTGLDTPTLRGLWDTAPYLHDGSAATLFDVIGARNPQGRHGPAHLLTPAEQQDLVAWLLSIDDLERGCRLPGTGEDLEMWSVVAGRPADPACQKEVAGGEVVRHVTESLGGTFHGRPVALIHQVHVPASPPLPTLPGLQLDRIDAVHLALPLSPGGLSVDTWLPPGFAGAVLRTQAIALSPQARNGTWATTGAHDVFLR